MTTDAQKLKVGVQVLATVAIAAAVLWVNKTVSSAAEEMGRAHNVAFTTISSQHEALRHEVEKMRMELSRDIRDLTRAVDLGVSTAQAEAWIELFRARLQAVEPRLVPTVPDLPARK